MDRIPTIMPSAPRENRPNEGINLYFLTIPQLIDYFDCKEKAKFQNNVFKKLFSKVMKEKYNCNIHGRPLSEDNETEDQQEE